MHHCIATCSTPLTETDFLCGCGGHEAVYSDALLSPILCCRQRAAHHHAAWQHTVPLVPVSQGIACYLAQVMHGHVRRGSQNLLAHRDVLHDRADCLLPAMPVADCAPQSPDWLLRLDAACRVASKINKKQKLIHICGAACRDVFNEKPTTEDMLLSGGSEAADGGGISLPKSVVIHTTR